MLDIYKHEKEQLAIRTDINLPIEIRDALDETG
jgi:hypothetical protein